MNDYTPIRLTPTLYGNFNLVFMPGTDAGDVARFNAAYCKQLGDPDYDHLTDWDANSIVNCVDRSQFMSNWPSNGIVGEACLLNPPTCP